MKQTRAKAKSSGQHSAKRPVDRGLYAKLRPALADSRPRICGALVCGAVALLSSLPANAAEPAHGQSSGRWRLDSALTLSRFEQQIKTEVGGARGERLVEDNSVGLGQMLSYRFWGPLSAGAFLRFDSGTRRAGRFTGFDADGRALVAPEVGGAYSELWIGPLIRAEWRALFIELGYGAFGARHDEARDDIPAENGDSGGLLRTHPSIAWLLGLGGGLPLAELPGTGSLELSLKLEYRVRYYTRRSGSPLASGPGGAEAVHGTQNLSPFAGVIFRFGD